MWQLACLIVLSQYLLTQPFDLRGLPSHALPGSATAFLLPGLLPAGLTSSRHLVLAYSSRAHLQASAPRASDDFHEYLKLARRHTKKASETEDELAELQKLMGCQFSNSSVLKQAVTHRSAAPKPLDSNQRLEFLGDAVLGLVVAEHLFEMFPHFDEGQLSTIRKEVISGTPTSLEEFLSSLFNACLEKKLFIASALAGVARKLGLGRFARLNAGEEATGGRNKEALLADLVEALIAAVFVDGGIDAARALVLRWLGGEMERAARDPSGSDFKSKLQERLRLIRAPDPTYHLVENGPKHNLKFSAHVLVGGKRLGWAVGKTKKAAEQAAASYSLQLLAGMTPDDVAKWNAKIEPQSKIEPE